MSYFPEVYFFGQVALAAILGAVVGWQRASWGKSAGARTYALVGGGATLFTIISLNIFASGNNALVAAQIVTGIGFLGAGMILHKENHVEGLTTAAGLWMMAAIGMTVGVKFYLLAVLTTVIMLIILMLDEQKFRKNKENTPQTRA